MRPGAAWSRGPPVRGAPHPRVRTRGSGPLDRVDAAVSAVLPALLGVGVKHPDAGLETPGHGSDDPVIEWARVRVVTDEHRFFLPRGPLVRVVADAPLDDPPGR